MDTPGRHRQRLWSWLTATFAMLLSLLICQARARHLRCDYLASSLCRE